MPKPVEFLGISFIDLFAGAFGAILILFIVIPKISLEDKQYLEKIKKIELDIIKIEIIIGNIKNKNPEVYKLAIIKMVELRKKIEDLKTQNNIKEQKINQLENKIASLKKQLKKTSFIFFTISWKTIKQDVDLWVIDPSNVLFNYYYREHTNHPGLISADALEGPGVEAWIILRPKPGRYKFYANLYTKNGNNQNPLIAPQIYTQKGLLNIKKQTLYTQYSIREYNQNNINKLTLLAIIDVKENGSIKVLP